MDKKYNQMKNSEIFYLKVPCVIKKFNKHNELKDTILNLINEQDSETLIQKDNYYGDYIDKLDWNKHSDFNRPWVKLFLPHFNNHLNTICNTLGFMDTVISAVWFQQYIKNSTHGWHSHGDNYTGVYYLELDKKSPTTELAYPDEISYPDKKNSTFRVNAEEGDIIIFPSFIKHRAPILDNNIRKTIISFNFNFNKILLDLLPK
jgi:hypothetical protein